MAKLFKTIGVCSFLFLFLLSGCKPLSNLRLKKEEQSQSNESSKQSKYDVDVDEFRDDVKEKASAQAIQWCKDKYGIEVSVVSVQVLDNNLFENHLFTINPDYGLTESAIVKVKSQDSSFEVLCDTATGENLDDAQQDEIEKAVKEYIQNTLQIDRVNTIVIDYGARKRVTDKYEDGKIEEFLEKNPLINTNIGCITTSLSAIKVEQLDNLGSTYIVNYASEEDWLKYALIISISPEALVTTSSEYAFVLTDAIVRDNSLENVIYYLDYSLQDIPGSEVKYCWVKRSSKIEVDWKVEPARPEVLQDGYSPITDTFSYDSGNGFALGSLSLYIPEHLLEISKGTEIVKFYITEENDGSMRELYFDLEVEELKNRNGYYIVELLSPYKTHSFTLLAR